MCALLNARSAAYFRATREVAFGAKLTELAPVGSEKRAKHWAGVKAAFDQYAKWLEADGSDKLFFLGPDRVAYADITFAAFLMWIRTVLAAESEEWKEMVAWDGGRWGKLLAAFEKYSAVDVGEQARL